MSRYHIVFSTCPRCGEENSIAIPVGSELEINPVCCSKCYKGYLLTISITIQEGFKKTKAVKRGQGE